MNSRFSHRNSYQPKLSCESSQWQAEWIGVDVKKAESALLALPANTMGALP